VEIEVRGDVGLGAKRLKELETENARLKKLLAESLLENEVAREALRKKW
jgi:putative transposase